MRYLILIIVFIFCWESKANTQDKIETSKQQYDLGVGYLKLGNDNKAFLSIKNSAELGYVNAQIDLAKLYELGIGTNKDEKRAFYWMEKAAISGSTIAMNNTAIYYKNGIGTPPNLLKSMEMYKRAANLGDLAAMRNLGVILFSLRKDKEKMEEGIYWTEKAASSNDITAILNLYSMYRYINENKKAIYWLNKAVEQEHPIAYFNMATLYSEKDSILGHDDRRAFEYYIKAIEMGDKFSANNLANWYLNGRFVDKNELEALRLYHIAASGGISESMYMLYKLYSGSFKNIPQDLEKAKYWLEKAKEKGFSPK